VATSETVLKTNSSIKRNQSSNSTQATRLCKPILVVKRFRAAEIVLHQQPLRAASNGASMHSLWSRVTNGAQKTRCDIIAVGRLSVTSHWHRWIHSRLTWHPGRQTATGWRSNHDHRQADTILAAYISVICNQKQW